MKISEITDKIVESQETYKIFDAEAFDKSVHWLDVLKNHPEHHEIELSIPAGETDIIAILDANAGIFQEEEYVPEIIEGFQIIEDENQDDLVAQLKNELALLEEENRNLTSMTELLDNQLESTQIERDILKNHISTLEEENNTRTIASIADEVPIISQPLPVEFKMPVPESSHVASFGQSQPSPAIPAPEAHVHEDADDDFHHGQQDDLDEEVIYDEEVTEPATTPKKNKLTPKKIGLICATLVVSGGMIYTLLVPKHNELPQQPKTTLAPPSLPAQLPAPIQQPMSSTITTPVVEAPAKASPKPAPVKTEAPAPVKVKEVLKEETPAPKKIQRNLLKYNKAGNSITLKENQKLRVYLSKDEQVTDVEGKDTDNWTIKYNQTNNYVTILPKSDKISNDIIIKTTKREYKLNAVSDKKASNAPVEFQY